jgi:hypothetical protein
MERMNELEYYNADDPEDVRGFRVIQTTDNPHPVHRNYWPVGHIIGYEHTFINFFHDVFERLRRGPPTHPNFEDGLACQKVLDAVDRSSRNRTWEPALAAADARARPPVRVRVPAREDGAAGRGTLRPARAVFQVPKRRRVRPEPRAG